jgi:(4S)-4-hydroxy-5-phosphonooxypentane-2,3-dione isomerase
MPQPTFAIAVTFEIKSEYAEAFRDRVLQQARDSVAKEPGCCQFDVLQDESSPTTFFLYETYLDAQSFEAHRQTSHFADFGSTVGPWVASKQLRRLNLLQENRS